MNPIVKITVIVALAAGAVFLGKDLKNGKEQEELQTRIKDATSRLDSLTRDLDSAKTRQIKLRAEVAQTTGLDAENIANLASITNDQKAAKEMLSKWAALEAERAAAVFAVREKEKKAPPAQMILADGTKLENFTLRSISEDGTLAVEHSNGLMKLKADRFKPEYAARLGLGWKPAPPAAPELRQSDMLNIALAKSAAEKAASPEEQGANKTLGSPEVGGALEKIEAELGKAMVALEETRRGLRVINMYKAGAKDKNGRNYGDLKKEANEQLATITAKVQSLQAERRDLQSRLKPI